MNESDMKKSTLSDVCYLVTDGTHDTPKTLNDGIPFIKAKEIVGGVIDFENCEYISYEDHLKVIARSKPEKGHLVDLTRIDFEALKKQFEKGHKRIETEKLKGLINRKLVQMVRLNKSRTDYLEKFQKMIEEYNSGSHNVETFFTELVDFAQELNSEERGDSRKAY